jgi:hypothetical protein
MSTLTIDYSLLGDNRTTIENVVTSLRAAQLPDSKIYGTLKMISATFKEVFEAAVKLVSDKPRSQNDIFNEFIANADWQAKFTAANQAMVLANAEREALLNDAESLPAASFKPRYTTGQDPQRKAWVIEIVVDKDGEHKDLFNLIDSRHEVHENATLALKAVSHQAVKALYPDGNDNSTANGEVVKSWKAIKVENEDGKWVAAGRAQAPVDPNKPRVLGVARVGKTKVTVTYGETLVAEGGNKNDIYTRAGRFAVAAGLPGWTDPRFASFGMKNGQEVLVATDWPHTGLPKLQAAGFTVKEELVAPKA